MNLRNIGILIILLLFFSASACNNPPKKSRKPVSQISILPKKKNLYTGDSIRFDIQIRLKEGSLDNAKLYLDNELVKTSDELNFSHPAGTLNSPGKHQLKVVATKTDGVEGVNFLTYEVLSDIEPEILNYEIVNTYPHNTEHFTQGFEIHQGNFYEGTGEYEKSGIYQFDLQTGQILKSAKLEDKYFGEGITILNNKLYQLTYKEKTGFIYELNTFARIDSFSYDTPEGWGLTNDGKYLIKTDGSEFLHFIHPETMQLEKKLPVYDNKGPVKYLNELEYYDGYIYANIWTTNYAVKIDAETGKVIAKINFEGLLSFMYNPDNRIDVLNGIAIDRRNGKMYVTGKLWPKLFEVKLVKTNPGSR